MCFFFFLPPIPPPAAASSWMAWAWPGVEIICLFSSLFFRSRFMELISLILRCLLKWLFFA